MDERPRVRGTASDGDIDRVVGALCAVDHKTAWARVLEIGRIVFQGIVNGDEAEWRSRQGKKDVSLRKLVQHVNCPFKKSALCSAVNVHLFARARPSVLALSGVTPTHVVQVLGLNAPLAFELLSASAEAGWSVRDLAREVRAARQRTEEPRGRFAAPSMRKATRSGRRALHTLRSMSRHLDGCPAPNETALRTLRGTIDELRALICEMDALPILSGAESAVLAPVNRSSGEQPDAAAG